MGRRDYSVSAKIKGRDEASSVFRRVGRGLKRYVGGPLRGINRGIGGIQRGLTALPGAVLAGGAIVDLGRTIVELATDSAAAGDSIAKTARRAGISAQSLQTLGYAAQIAGGSQEALNKGVQNFAKYLGQLKAGTGPLETLLKKASPDLRKMLLAAEDTESALRLMFDALGQLDDDKRLALATAAFGRAGYDLALISEGGIEALEKLEARARRYGHVMGGEALKASEDATDALTDLKLAWQGLKTVFGAALIEEGLPHLRRLTEWIADNKGEVYDMARGFAVDLVDGMKSVAEALPGVLAGLKKIGDFLIGIIDGLDTLFGSAVTTAKNAQGRTYGGTAVQVAEQYQRNYATASRFFAGDNSVIGRDETAAGLITVRFEGTPPGTRVDIQRGSKGVKTDVGRRPVLP